MAKRLILLASAIVVALILAITGQVTPRRASADYPLPQGPAASCDGGTSPICGSYNAKLRVNLANGADGGFLGRLPVKYQAALTTKQDCLASAVDGGGIYLDCVSVTGTDGGIYPVHPLTVYNTITDAGNGVITAERAVTTSAATPATMTFAIPAGTSGTLAAIVSAHSIGDAGTNGGSTTWSCGVINHGGTCQVYSACASVSTWGATDGGVSWTVALAITSCVATVTATATSGAGSVDWLSTFQYQNAH